MGGIKYETTEQFAKDLKRLAKRYQTLAADLATAKRNAIELLHIHNIDNQGCFLIPGLSGENLKIFKLKKFACQAMKGKGVKSGIRVIYAFIPAEGKIIFIEIYYKGEQVNEDKERIRGFIKNYKS